MKDRRGRAKARNREPRDKPAEREAERQRRESLEGWFAEQPDTRIDGLGRPFRPGS